MSNISCLLVYQLGQAATREVTVFDSGRILVNVPCLTTCSINHQIEECGVVCTFEHTIKYKNGHYVTVPDKPTDALPEWTGELDGIEPQLSKISLGNDCAWLVWKLDCLVPLGWAADGNYGLLLECFKWHFEAQLHIIEANQAYTKRWLAMVRSAY